MRLLFSILLLFSLNAFSQAFGARLLDASSQIHVEGATILSNKGQAILSDKEVYFSIPAKRDDSLFITNIRNQPLKLKLFIFSGQPTLFLQPSSLSLKEVVVKATLGNALVSTLQKIDLTTRPINNSQELLRIVPGLFIGQHAGILTIPLDHLLLNAAVWLLHLNQEFIYAGDEALVEPGGKTLRKGIDFSARYEISKGLFTDLDLYYTIGKALEAPAGEQYLPLAPRFSSTGGLSYKHEKWNAGLRYRWLGDCAANETNSQVAKGYAIAEANAHNQLNHRWSVGLIADNLFNVKCKETQFLTESCLKNEMSAVEEIHFTPGSPFFI